MATEATSSVKLAATAGGFTVVVRRQIKPGREAEFEEAMRGFVDYALRCPGYLSLSILCPVAGQRDYTVIGKFVDERARRQFTATAEYSTWMSRLGELTDGDAAFTESSVLDEWVRAATVATTTTTPPKWKTAVATLAGVWPVVTLLGLYLTPFLVSWPYILSSVVLAAATVTLLTWFVMPTVSRVLRPWLYPAPAAPVSATPTPPAQS